MAGEVQLPIPTAPTTAYFTVKNTSGQYWNGTAFEARTAGNWANYAITLTRFSTSFEYFGNFPTGITTGSYYLTAFVQAGGSPAIADAVVGQQDAFQWSGSVVVSLDSRLAPTVAGRTLDVSSGGEAGLDWANVGSPTTTVNLSGTTVSTAQKVDVETIKTNPVVNGGTITFPSNATVASTTNITAGTVTTATNVTTVNGLAAGVITAASIAADAITDAKVASDVTIASVTGAVGSVTGSVGSVATGGITSASFASGAIDAAAIAADAIGASELAADAVAEIQNGLATAAGITDIQSRLPTALVSGRMASDAIAVSGSTNAADHLEVVFDTDYATAYNTTVKGFNVRLGNYSQGGGSASLSFSSITAGSGIDISGSVSIDMMEVLTNQIAWNSSWTTEIQSGVDSALVARGLDHLVSAAVSGTDITDNSIIAKLASKSATADWDTFSNQTDSLEAIRDRGDVAWITATGFSTLDAAGIRSAVGLASANLDTQLDALPTNSELSTALAGADDAVLAQVALVKAKTDNLPSDPADASDIAASFASIASTLDTLSGYVDTEVAAIKAKTDNLPTDPADASDIAASFATVNTKLDAIDDYVDTEVAAIKAKTDSLTFTVAGQIDANVLDWKSATAPSMTGDAFARLGAPAGASVSADVAAVSANVDAVKAKTDLIPASPAAVGSAMTLAANSITSSVLDSTAGVEIADAVLSRNVSNVEGTMPEHCLGTTILGMLEWSVDAAGTTLTIKGTDGTTTRFTKALATAMDSGNVITGAN